MEKRLLAGLLSLVVAATGVTGVVLHVCESMGGIAPAGCDCGSRRASSSEHSHEGHHAQPSQHAPKLRAQPCCRVETSDARVTLATFEATSTKVPDASFAYFALASPSAAMFRICPDAQLVRQRAPPNIHGPPAFIRHCALLN